MPESPWEGGRHPPDGWTRIWKPSRTGAGTVRQQATGMATRTRQGGFLGVIMAARPGIGPAERDFDVLVQALGGDHPSREWRGRPVAAIRGDDDASKPSGPGPAGAGSDGPASRIERTGPARPGGHAAQQGLPEVAGPGGDPGRAD